MDRDRRVSGDLPRTMVMERRPNHPQTVDEAEVWPKEKVQEVIGSPTVAVAFCEPPRPPTPPRPLASKRPATPRRGFVPPSPFHTVQA